MIHRLFVYLALFTTSLLGAPSPTAEPSRDEKLNSSDIWDWILINIRPVNIVSVTSCLVLESTTLLLLHHPEHSVSRVALPFLCLKQPSLLSLSSVTYSIWFGMLLGLTGGLLRNWCFKTLGKFFTYDLAILKSHKLITSGPYSYVRHPSYTGGIMMSIGTLIYLYNPTSYLSACGILGNPHWALKLCGYFPGALSLVSILGLLRRHKTEERMLSARFGKQWHDYCKEVPYALFPGIDGSPTMIYTP